MQSRLFLHVLICGFGMMLAPHPMGLFASDAALAAGTANDFSGGWIEEDGGPDAPAGTVLRFPGMPPMHLGPDGRILGEDDPQRPAATRRLDALKPSLSPQQRARAAKAAALKRAMAPQKTHAALRTEMLDTLFKRLGTAADADAASGIAVAIEHIWLHSDSATAALLMTRALTALQAGHLPLALTLFDGLLVLQPDWAEAWDKRAMTRFLGGDFDGAVADMRQVLKLEPRNFSALATMGFALQREGLDKPALSAFQKSLALDPQQPQIKALVDKLSIKVEGRDI